MKYKKYTSALNILGSGTATSHSNKFFYCFVIALFIPLLLFFIYLPFSYKIAICTLLAAFLSLTLYSIIYALLSLILTYILASICFFLVGLDFLALCLIFIYVGAIAVLFIFVVMTLSPGKVIRAGQMQFFEKLCLLVFSITVITISILAGLHNFGEDLFSHWFEVHTKTGLFISNRGRAELLTDIGLTLYGQQSYLFILIVLLLFLGFLCPILLTLDEDAENRKPTSHSLRFPLTGEYVYFLYFYIFMLYFTAYMLMFKAQADVLNNIEYYLLLKFCLIQLPGVPRAKLLNWESDDNLLRSPISSLVYSPRLNDELLIQLLSFIPGHSLSYKVWLRAVHDVWQEYIRHHISLELTPLIEEVVNHSQQLNERYALIQRLANTGQLSPEVEISLYANFLRDKTFFDIAALYLVFYSSLLMNPDESHSFTYVRSCLKLYELNNSGLYPLDFDGSLRNEAFDTMFSLTNKCFGSVAEDLNLYAGETLWNTDLDAGLSLMNSRLLWEHPIIYMRATRTLRVEPKDLRDMIFEFDDLFTYGEIAAKKHRPAFIKPRHIKLELPLTLLVPLGGFTMSKDFFFTNLRISSKIFYYQNYILLSFMLSVMLTVVINYCLHLEISKNNKF